MSVIRVILGVACLAGSVGVAAQLQDPNDAMKAARSLGNSAARYEMCGVNTSASLQLVKDMANVCGATTSERNQMISAFTISRGETRVALQTMSCEQVPAVAQKNYSDSMSAAHDMLQSGCH